jgi:iron-sulfur cluster assembly accessory protein
VEQLSALLDSPTPKLIRIGVRNKGCAGMAYHLEYVEKPGKFDEVIKQDGVTVLIDSKALFSIVGSEMDWQEDKISSKFVFKSERRSGYYKRFIVILLHSTDSLHTLSLLDPNIKEQCGCGESFVSLLSFASSLDLFADYACVHCS